VHDPDEGLTADGMIRTGVGVGRIPAAFAPVVRAAVDAVGSADARAELHLYGSVATGTAVPGRSDVDLMTIGLAEEEAGRIGAELSRTFAGTCRGVAIGAAQPDDFADGTDERYGNRVFLRHYCVPLRGADALRSPAPFPGDARAARGFNGDIGDRLQHWRRGLESRPAATPSARRIARKTLFAVTGLVSVHDRVWTTDRHPSGRRWAELQPRWKPWLTRLGAWADGRSSPSGAELTAVLADDGIVAAVVDSFAADIGLWSR
jgi:uncharacterized protein